MSRGCLAEAFNRVQTSDHGLFRTDVLYFQPVPHPLPLCELCLTLCALPQLFLSAFPRPFIISHQLFLGFPLCNPDYPSFHCHLHVFSTKILSLTNDRYCANNHAIHQRTPLSTLRRNARCPTLLVPLWAVCGVFPEHIPPASVGFLSRLLPWWSCFRSGSGEGIRVKGSAGAPVYF